MKHMVKESLLCVNCLLMPMTCVASAYMLQELNEVNSDNYLNCSHPCTAAQTDGAPRRWKLCKHPKL